MDDLDPWQTADGEYGYFSGKDLYSAPPHKNYIIDNFLYERDVMCISSAPGIGKTMLALQMMCNLTTGSPLFGTYSIDRPMNVLYVQSEGDRVETLERISLMKEGMGLDDTRWAHINIPGAKLNELSDFSKFCALVDTRAMIYDVVFLDPLYTLVGGSLNEDQVATNWIRNIRTFKAYHNCAIVVLHHDAKDLYNEGQIIDRGNNVTYGSVFWQAFFNQNFKLKRKKEVYTLENGKQRNGKLVDKVDLVLHDSPLMFTTIDEEAATSSFVVTNVIGKGPAQGMEPRAIIKASGLSKATVYRALRKLQDNKQIEPFYAPHHTYYRLVKKEAKTCS